MDIVGSLPGVEAEVKAAVAETKAKRNDGLACVELSREDRHVRVHDMYEGVK
jgi:hypothetical protein